MPRKVYTKEMHEFIIKNVKGATAQDLTDLVNKKFGTDITVTAIRSYKTAHKLKGERGTGKPIGLPSEVYPDDLKNYIFENYLGVGPTSMAKKVNAEFGTDFTRGRMKGFYSRFKLDSGLKGTEGIEPPNKGKKFPGTGNITTFKKGNKPNNYRPIGSERINTYGYIDIKVADPDVWEPKHRMLWEKQNGKIPGNKALVFADGNKLNLDMDNLLLVSREELLILNRCNLIKEDKELTKTGLMVAKIIDKTSKLMSQ